MKFEIKRFLLDVTRCLIAIGILFLVFALLNLEWSLYKWTWSSFVIWCVLSIVTVYNIFTDK